MAQTVREFEVIVVDDGSTDSTAEVAASYGDKIRYVYQDNMGLAGVRNTGVREARGQYVSFLDSDDMWAPNYIEKILELAEQNPDAGLFCAGITYVDKVGKPLSRDSIDLVAPEKCMKKSCVEIFCTALLRFGLKLLGPTCRCEIPSIAGLGTLDSLAQEGGSICWD